MDFGKDQDFSYVVIYKTDTVSSSYETALLSKRDGSNGYQLYLRSSNGGAPSDDAITFIGSEDENSKYFATSTESNHKDDLLHIVSSTFDKDGANVIYLDGNKKSEVLIHEIGNSSSTFPLEIGHEFYTGQTSKYFYEGEIAEIIIYDRVLDQSELAKLSYYLSKKWERTNFVNSDDDGMYDFEDPSPTGPINEPKRAAFEIEFADIAGNTGVPVYETNEQRLALTQRIRNFWMFPSFPTTWIIPPPGKMIRSPLSFKTTEPIQTPTSSDISISGLDTLEFNKIDTEGKQWEVSGTVLDGQNGNASFSIEVLDLAGNKGSPVTATDDNTQVVLDTTTPTLSGITLVSTNANNSQAFAKPGDNITLSFNSSEPIQIPSITLADNDSLTVHDTSSNQDGTSWKAVYTVTAGEAERDTTFSIDFKDIAGNEGVSKDQTVATNTIKIDTSIPTLSVVSLSGGTNNLANEGDVVTLSFTGSENIKNPMVLLSGERKPLEGTKTSWSTTYTVKAKDDVGKSPYGIEELVLWLDASNIDGRLNSSLSDGDKVREWIDLSEKGNDVYSLNNDNQPHMRSGIMANNSIEFKTNYGHFFESKAKFNDDLLNIENDFTVIIVKKDYDKIYQGDSNSSYMLYAESLVSSADDYSFEIYREGKTYPNKNKFIVKATGAWTEDYITKTNIVPNEVESILIAVRGKILSFTKIITRFQLQILGRMDPLQIMLNLIRLG